MQMETIKEYNPNGKRYKVPSDIRTIIQKHISKIANSSMFKLNLKKGRFYLTDVEKLEKMLSAIVFGEMNRNNLAFHPNMVKLACQYAVKDLIGNSGEE